MANTITTEYILTSQRRVVAYTTIYCDGTLDTHDTVYSSSTVATTLGGTSYNFKDPKTCTIKSISYSNTTGTALWLGFDATTAVVAWPLVSNFSDYTDFTPVGGLVNTGTTGRTGDLFVRFVGAPTANTTFSIVLEVIPGAG